MDKRAAEQYLTTVFGSRKGHVAVAYKDQGQSWQECQFAWPADRGKLLGWAEVHSEANIFVCPALRKDGHTRKKGDMQPSQWLWADVDWQGVPNDRTDDIKARIDELGSLVVRSGSGDNVHVYVKLDRPVEHEEFIKLNTGLRDYLLADNKQADNSLLRLPGTTNWKTTAGSPVVAGGGHDKALGVDLLKKRRAFRDAKVIQDAESSAWEFTEVDGLPRRIKAMVGMSSDEAESRYGSRFKAVWAVTGELHKRGMGEDEIHSLMDKFPAALSKAADENGYDVHRDVAKRLSWDRAQSVTTLDDDEEVNEDAGDVFESASEEEMLDSLIEEGKQKELLRRAIRRAADMAEALSGHTEPPDDTSSSVTELLANPPAADQYLIDGLASADATVAIVGQYKTGKTALMIASLISSIADNEPFLGSRAVHVGEAGMVVGHWNLEMSPLDLVDKYIRKAQYKNGDNIQVANWQGYRVNLLTPPGKAMAIKWLTTRRVQVWTIDSWTALCRSAGVDPNDGVAVGRLIQVLTEIKLEAGIRVMFLLAHIARGSKDDENPGTKGAVEFDAWVDTRWVMFEDGARLRWLGAEGRGTAMSPVSMVFDEETQRSVMGETTKVDAAKAGWVQEVTKIVAQFPQGINEARLFALMKERGGIAKTKAIEFMEEAADSGFIRREKVRPVGAAGGGRVPWMHFPSEDRVEGDRTRKATAVEVDMRGVSVRPRRRPTA